MGTEFCELMISRATERLYAKCTILMYFFSAKDDLLISRVSRNNKVQIPKLRSLTM